MNVSAMSFYAKISDPLVGGTYMTLMNTISNLGFSWIKTYFLWLMDVLTWNSCILPNTFNSTVGVSNNFCQDSIAKEKCVKAGGSCVTHMDGFFIEVLFGIVFAAFWYFFGRRTIKSLQNSPIKSWHVLSNRPDHPDSIGFEQPRV